MLNLNYIKIRNFINWLHKAVSYVFLRKRNKAVQINEDLQLLIRSGYFDKEWYLKNYPDITSLEIDPAIHYLLYGSFEGRNPGTSFSSSRYLKTHPDLVTSRINPLIHYLRYEQSDKIKNRTHVDLHVGLHKTGTSAIQKFLRTNSHLLEEKGFYYPLDYTNGDAQHLFPSALRRSAPLENIHYAQNWISDCERYCKAHNMSLLISTEVLSEPIRYEELAKILRPFEVNVVIYIRRQDLLIESVINQVLKDRQEAHPEDVWNNFDNVYVTDFIKRVCQWRDIFPDGKITVRRYDRNLGSSSLEMEFLNVVGLQLDNPSFIKSNIVNESLRLYEFMVLRKLVLNRAVSSPLTFENARIKLAKIVAKYKISDFRMVGNYFNYETRKHIMEMHQDTNERIRAEFFPGDAYLFDPIVNVPDIEINLDIISRLESEMLRDLS